MWSGGSALLAGLVFLGTFIGGLLAAPYPSDASAPASGVAYLLDAHGHYYAQIKPAEARAPLTDYKDIGQTMVDAITAAEDERYFQHGGVDPLAIARAAWSDVTGGNPSGASTITQQYVKNVFDQRQHTLLRKVREAALAVRLDRAKSKQEILRLYLNSVYFGNNTYGVEAAAKFYFNKHSKELDCGEAAMLAGLVSAPSAHEPVHHFDAAKQRQHYVLDREVALGKLTPERATQCYEEITPASIRNEYTGPPRTSYPEYTDAVTEQVRKLGPDLLQRGNVVVRTPLDTDLQKAAKQALTQVLPTATDPSAAVVGINPKTGDVLTIATAHQRDPSGKLIGYPRFGFDLATDGAPISGSTIKPFTLAAALASGNFSLGTGYSGPPSKSIPVSGCQTYELKNAEDGEGGYFSLQGALAQSVNTVYAQLAVDVGLSKVKAMATAAGIPTVFSPRAKSSANRYGFVRGFDGAPKTKCPVYPSQSLGVAVSPLDMATAYSTIANGGTYRPQRFLSEVRVGTSTSTSNDGTAISLPPLTPSHRAMSTTVATQVQTAMRDVVTIGTAAGALGNLPDQFSDLIGKTGTTDQENNAWFIGCLPTLCVAVWMGSDPAYVHGQPNSMNGTEGVNPVFGGTLPAKIFATTLANYQTNLKQSGQRGLTSGALATPSGGAGGSGGGGYSPPAARTGPTASGRSSRKPTGKSSSAARRSAAPVSSTPGAQPAPTGPASPNPAPSSAAPPPSSPAGLPTAPASSGGSP